MRKFRMRSFIRSNRTEWMKQELEPMRKGIAPESRGGSCQSRNIGGLQGRTRSAASSAGSSAVRSASVQTAQQPAPLRVKTETAGAQPLFLVDEEKSPGVFRFMNSCCAARMSGKVPCQKRM